MFQRGDDYHDTCNSLLILLKQNIYDDSDYKKGDKNKNVNRSK